MKAIDNISPACEGCEYLLWKSGNVYCKHCRNNDLYRRRAEDKSVEKEMKMLGLDKLDADSDKKQIYISTSRGSGKELLRRMLNSTYGAFGDYIDTDIAYTYYTFNTMNQLKGEATLIKNIPSIKKVIFNNPATIVLWADGTKTIVKCDSECEPYDPEKGMAMAITKKALDNKGNYFNEIKKWVNPYWDEKRKDVFRNIDEIHEYLNPEEVRFMQAEIETALKNKEE